MTSPPRRAAPTREHRPPTEDKAPLERPALLVGFPRPAFLPWPAVATAVGWEWLADAGIPDDEVSTKHLRFHRARGRIELEDVGSTNGTFVDGQRVVVGERVALEDGAIIRLGRTIAVYREAYTGPSEPQERLGRMVGPWGLWDLRVEVDKLRDRRLWNVLLLGESGTGKQLLAEEIARILERGGPRFGEINVAAVPEDRIEAELFGWEKGAFTGSSGAHPGIIRGCRGGAVFLDEIGELPLGLQPKLLRLLENHEVQPLGALQRETVDVVIVAATNRSLDEEVKAGRFRLDLRARFPIRLSLPRLADRPEDLFALLAELYIRAHGPLDLDRVRVDVEAIELLMLHDWPANIRELDLLVQAIDPRIGLKLSVARQVLGVESPAKAPPLTRESIMAALAKHDGNQSKAARELSVPRSRFLRAMKKHGIGGGAAG